MVASAAITGSGNLPHTFADTGRRSRTVLVVGHAYVVRANRQKFDLLVSRHEVRCVLFVPRRWRSEWGRDLLAQSERIPDGVEVVAAPVWLNGRPGGFVFPPYLAWRTLRRVRPDIVHIEQEAYSLAAFEMVALAKLAGVPVVLFVWENLDRKLSWVRRCTRRFTLRHVDTLIGGNHVAADFEAQAGYRGQVKILPQMGVDLARYSGRRRERDPGHTLRVGFLGRLVTGKGVDLLLEACSVLIGEGLAVRLTIVGSGPASAALRDLGQRLGIGTAVEWLDAVPHDEVPTTLTSLDVVVLPSRGERDWQEQFGRVLIEAMAEGLPVVGSSSGEIPNVIGRADLVFAEDESVDLARILRRLTTEPGFYDDASRHSLERVRSEFSQEQIADTTNALWEELLARRAAPS